MKIETKFNIGDECYLMENNTITKATVEKIEISVIKTAYSYAPIVRCDYTISKGSSHRGVYDYEIFKSVEELLAHLEENVL